MGRCARSRAPGWGCSPTSGASYGRSRFDPPAGRCKVHAGNSQVGSSSSLAVLAARGRHDASPGPISWWNLAAGNVMPADGVFRRSAGVRCSRPTTRGTKNVSKLPVRSDSATLVRRISATGGRTMLHADFGGGGAYGIPFKVVPDAKAWPIHYTAYGDESDPGPFPIPSNAPSKAARRAPAIGTCSSCSSRRAISSSSTTRTGAAAVGTPTPARTGTSGRTSCARSAGRRPTRRASRSCPASRATTRSRAARSITRCGSRSRRPNAGTSFPQRTSPRARPTRRCPMGLRLRLNRELRPLALPRPGVGDPAGAEAIRDDRRRQRRLVVHHRRRRPALERRRPQPAQDGSPAGPCC